MTCPLHGCGRPSGDVRVGTEAPLVHLCDPHRRAARSLARWHRTGLAPQVERLAELARRPWCERCRSVRAAVVRYDTDPRLAGLCCNCRDSVRRYGQAPGRVRGVSLAEGRGDVTALLASADDTARTLAEYERPTTRGDCLPGGCNEERPCPFVSCRWNLALSVSPAGSLRLEHPGREVWELKETCALDVAESGGLTLEDVGELVNLTRERVRQIEQRAARALRRPAARLGLGELLEDEPDAVPAAPVSLRRVPRAAAVDQSEDVVRSRWRGHLVGRCA